MSETRCRSQFHSALCERPQGHVGQHSAAGGLYWSGGEPGTIEVDVAPELPVMKRCWDCYAGNCRVHNQVKR